MALLLTTCIRPAGAANPRIRLKVERATAAEAAAQLSRAASIPVEFQVPMLTPGEPVQPEIQNLLRALNEKSDFDWSDVTFARALRGLVARYGLGVSRIPTGGYLLTPGAQPDLQRAPKPAPGRRPGQVEVKGIGISLLQLQVSDQLDLDLRGPLPAGLVVPRRTRLQLLVLCDLGDGDAETVSGLDNLTAKDDQGNFLIMEPRFARPRFPGHETPYPDQYSDFIHLSGPHPKATRLDWLDGDLVVFKKNQPAVLELALPLKNNTIERSVGELTVHSVVLTQNPPAPQDKGPSYSLNMRLTAPEREVMQLPDGNSDLTVVLLGISGKEYRFPVRFNVNGTTTLSMGIGTLAEPATAMRLQVTERSQPLTRVHFRMKEIPLPHEGIFTGQRTAQPGRPGAQPEQPSRRHGGATLVSPILIENGAAGEGNLSLGLSQRSEDGWSAVRWIDVAVGKDGIGRLEELRPGEYRVLRAFRPTEVPELAGPGRWEGGEQTVRVEPGKELRLPPLRWTARPASTPNGKNPAGRSPIKKSSAVSTNQAPTRR